MTQPRRNKPYLLGRLVLACSFAACLAVGLFLYDTKLPGQGGPESDPVDFSGETPLGSIDAGASSSSQCDPILGKGRDTSQLKYADDEGEVLTWENGAEYRAGEAIVELAEGVSAAELDERLGKLDFATSGSVSAEDVADGWAKIEFTPDLDVANVIERLEHAQVVESAQPNYVYHTLEGAGLPVPEAAEKTASASEPLFAAGNVRAQYDGDGDDDTSFLRAIGAYDAWETCKTNKSVTVAVIDSGCDTTHADLKRNIVDSYNVVTGGKSVVDSTGHGTHIAGIIAAVPNNGIGVAGVSFNAGLMPVKVMKGNTADTAALLKAYQYVIRNAKRYNVRVVNMSLGAEQYSLDSVDAALLRIVDKAYRAGILSIFPAGNDDDVATPYYCFPCDFAENSIGVVNVDDARLVASAAALNQTGSNYNLAGEKTKDLAAPGVSIYSTAPNGSYAYLTGTSMASPVVAGVAALVFAANPSLNARQAKSVLCSTALDLTSSSGSKKKYVGFDDYTGYGLVRADRAVAGAASSYVKGPDSVVKGATAKLSVPSSGTWKWASGDKKIATVNASTGLVRGVKPGEAVISATNGKKTLYRTMVVYEVKFRGASSVAVGGSAVVSGYANPVSMWTYSSSNPKIASVGSASGKVFGKKAGTAVITARLSACPSIKIAKKIRVVKNKNTMVAVGSTTTISRSLLKSKARKYKGIYFQAKAKGKVTYSKVAKGSSDRLLVNKKTGKITVKRFTRCGAYRIKVKVEAAGNAAYKPLTKTVTCKVIVR